MTIEYLRPLERGWERASRILFRPLDPVRWLVIGFAAWLAGLGRDMGCAFGARSDGDSFRRLPLEAPPHWFNRGEVIDHLWTLPFVVIALMVALALVVLVLWLSSRAKLVFLDNVVREEAVIVEPWGRLRELGNSLFLWRLGFAAATLLVLLVALGLTFGPMVVGAFDDGLRALSFAGMLFGGGLLLVFGVAVALVLLLLDSFVVPIMYRFNLSATAAWKALLPWLKARPGAFLLYALLLLALSIVVAIGYTIVCVLTCCVAALPYVGTVLLLPLWIDYRAFSVEFLAQLHPDFDLFRRCAPAEVEIG